MSIFIACFAWGSRKKVIFLVARSLRGEGGNSLRKTNFFEARKKNPTKMWPLSSNFLRFSLESPQLQRIGLHTLKDYQNTNNELREKYRQLTFVNLHWSKQKLVLFIFFLEEKILN